MPRARSAAKTFWLLLLFACGGDGASRAPLARSVRVPPLTESTPVGSIPGTFSVSVTGTARYQIPLTVPHGRAGMTPALSLSYDSGTSSGLLGQGWSIGGLSRIHRCPGNIALDGDLREMRWDDGDPLCLDGRRLVLVSGEHGKAGSVYRTEEDNLAAIRLAKGVSSPTGSFEVHTRGGRVLTYGGSEDSNVLGRGQVRSWALSRIADRHGNYISFAYAFEVSTFGGVPHHDSHRIDTIRYTGGPATLGALKAEPQRSVVFRYTDREPELIVQSFWHGARATLQKQLYRIDAYGPDGQLTRSYVLGYAETYKGSGLGVLDSLRECDGAGVCLPPTVFEYTAGVGVQPQSVAWDTYPYHLDPDDPQGVRDAVTLDADGDGAQDMVVAGPDGYQLFRARGAGEGPTFTPIPLDIEYSKAARLVSADVDKDGCDDLLHMRGDRLTYYQSQCSGASFLQDASIAVPGDSDDPEVFLDAVAADFTGDGHPDVMVCHLQLPRPGGCEVVPSDDCECLVADPAMDCDEFGCSVECDPSCDNPSYACPPKHATWTLYTTAEDGTPFHQASDTGIDCAENCGFAGCARQSSWQILDTDHDGKTELLQIEPLLPRTENGLSQISPEYVSYEFDLHGDLSSRPTGLPADLFQRYNTRRAGRSLDRLADVNGDGRIDIVRFEPAPDPAIPGELGDHVSQFDSHFHDACEGTDEPFHGAAAQVHYNTGDGFARGQKLVEFDSWEAFCDQFRRSVPGDWNGDGRVDLIFPRTANDLTELWVASSILPYTTDVAPTGIVLDDPDGRIRPLDFMGSGKFGMAVWQGDPDSGQGVWRLYARTGTDDLLASVTNGLGHTTTVEYLPMTRPEVYDPGGCHDDEDPWVTCVASTRAVVARTEEETSINVIPKVREFRYSELRHDHQRGTSLGLRRHTSIRYLGTQQISATVTELDNQTYDAERRLYPFAGRVRERTTYTLHSGSGRMEVVHDQRVPILIAIGGGESYVVRELERSGRIWDVSGTCNLATLEDCPAVDDLPVSALTVERRAAVLSFNSLGDPSERLIDEGDNFTLTESRTFYDPKPPWRIANPRQIVTVGAAPDGTTKRRTTELTYDFSGALKTMTIEPSSATRELVTTFSYDLDGNLIHVEHRGADGEGGWEPPRSVSITYDDEGVFPATTTNAEGHVLTGLYDPGLGELVYARDPNGVENHLRYDGFGRLTRQWRSAGGVDEDSAETITLLKLDHPDDPDLPSPVGILSSRANGQVIRIEQDQHGREVYRQWKGFFGTPLYSTMSWEPAGWLGSRSMPAVLGDSPAGYWTYERDESGRLLEIDPPFVGATTYAYEGRSVLITDPRDHKWIRTVDRQGRAKLTQDPYGTTVCQYYGPFGFPSETHVNTRPRCELGAPPAEEQPATTDSYVIRVVTDAYGRKLELQDPNLGERTNAFNAFGELIRADDELGNTTFAYDRLGRLVSRKDADGENAFHWDVVDGVGAYGMLGSATSADGVEQRYLYDSFARLDSETLVVDGESFTTSYEYAPSGLLERIDYPPGPGGAEFAVAYAYDPYGTMVRVYDALTSVDLWELMETDPSGHVVRERFGNGLETTWTYDGPLVRGIKTEPVGGGTAVQRLTYDYDDTGNLTERADLQAARFETFTYDAVDRLWSQKIEEKTGAGVVLLGSWSIDYGPLGNIEHRSDVGTYRYEDPKKPLAVTSAGGVDYTYDDIGRQITRDGATIEYTPRSRPRTITAGGQVATSTFDAGGDTVRKSVSEGGVDTETVYVGSLLERVTTKTPPFTVERTYHYHVPGPDRVLARVRRTQGFGGVVSTVQYLHTDHLGSTDTITSSAGAVVQRQSYDAFGAPRGEDWDTSQPYENDLDWSLGYTGHDEQRHAGLIDMGGRLYDPRIGRFAAADPFIPDPDTTQAYDRFSYVYNRPLSFTDPTGFAPVIYIEFDDEIVVGDPAPEQPAPTAPEPEPPPEPDYYNPGIYSNRYYSEPEEIELEPTDLSWEDSTIEAALGAADALVARTKEEAPKLAVSYAMSNPILSTFGSPVLSVYFVNEGIQFWEHVFEAGVAQVALEATPLPAALSAYEAAEAGDVRGAVRHGLDAAANAATWFIGAGSLKLKPGKCFAAGTLVHTEDGLVPIESIEVGDRVLARDPDTGAQGYRAVTRRFVTADQELLAITAEGASTQEILKVTPEHPFWVRDRGWTAARDLVPGDQLVSAHGGWLRVGSGTWLQGRHTVYNLEVDGYHTYFVGEAGAWVHNTCPRRPVSNVSRRVQHRDGSVSYTIEGRTVRYSRQGYPDFSRFLYRGKAGRNTVWIRLTGSRRADIARANQKAGFKETPDGYTWHHHENLGKMQLVKEDVHNAFPHSGGVFRWQKIHDMWYGD